MFRFCLIICLIINLGLIASSKSVASDSTSILIEKAVSYSSFRIDSLNNLAQDFENLINLHDNTLHDSAGYLFVLGMIDKRNGERSLAETNFRKALKMAFTAKDEKLQNQIKLQLAKYMREERTFLESGKLISEVLAYFKTLNDSINIFYAYKEFGQLHFDQGRNTSALHNYLEASKYISGRKKLFAEAEIHRLIGSSYYKLAELFSHINAEKSIVYYNESMRYIGMAHQYFESMDQLYWECSCKIDLMQTGLKLGDVLFTDSLKSKSASCYSVPDNAILIGLHKIQSQIERSKGQQEKAIEELQKVLIIKYKMLAPVQYYEAYHQFGLLIRENGFSDSSYKIMTNTAIWFADRGLRQKAFESYSCLSDWYEKDTNISLALEANKKASELKNLLVDEADMEIFDELRYKYQNQQLEERLQEAVKKGLLQKKQLIILLIISILLVAIMVMTLFFVSLLRKKSMLMKQLANEKEAKTQEENKTRKLALDQIKVQHELVQQKAAASKLLAEKKDQELLLNVLRRTQMISFQKEMMLRLQPFITKLGRKTDREAFEALMTDFRHESENDPMNQFELVFKQAYGDFYSKLIETAPDLSRSEIQVAVLLRLNLTSKEIAHILSLTTATIERTRHQLRQKLNLEPNQQLVAWLIGLG